VYVWNCGLKRRSSSGNGFSFIADRRLLCALQ